MNGEWDIVISLLQDVCQANQNGSLDPQQLASPQQFETESEEMIQEILTKTNQHKENVERAQRIVGPMLDNINSLILLKQGAVELPGSDEGAAAIASKNTAKRKREPTKKVGRSYYTSPYNPSEPIVPGLEVAFKLRSSSLGEEWIQCKVLKVLDHGKFDIRDIEPDENNNPGRIYRSNWKEILLIPTLEDAKSLIAYPFGTKVVARYPETTTFYPAEVIGTKRDGRCRLRFDGEEEVGKETEVERRLVLPYPDAKVHH